MYEAAVQDPEQQIRVIEKIYRDNFTSSPAILKEDFSGTFWISAEWVKRRDNNFSIAVDLDKRVLRVGKSLHYQGLSSTQKKRIKILNQNVTEVTAKKADIVVGCNFSFFIFQQREQLAQYFKAAFKSLKKQGVFILETIGGSGFEEAPFKESRTIKRNGKNWFKYTWHHNSFDPINRRGQYSIQFDLNSGKKFKDAFTYDWRLWTIPEVKDLMLKAGFSSVQVYWEQDKPDNEGFSKYKMVETADNDYHTWIAYIVGVKG